MLAKIVIDKIRHLDEVPWNIIDKPGSARGRPGNLWTAGPTAADCISCISMARGRVRYRGRNFATSKEPSTTPYSTPSRKLRHSGHQSPRLAQQPPRRHPSRTNQAAAFLLLQKNLTNDLVRFLFTATGRHISVVRIAGRKCA